MLTVKAQRVAAAWEAQEQRFGDQLRRALADHSDANSDGIAHLAGKVQEARTVLALVREFGVAVGTAPVWTPEAVAEANTWIDEVRADASTPSAA